MSAGTTLAEIWKVSPYRFIPDIFMYLYIKTRNKAVGNEFSELPLFIFRFHGFQDVQNSLSIMSFKCPSVKQVKGDRYLSRPPAETSEVGSRRSRLAVLRFAKTLAKMSSKNDWLPPLSINWFRWGPPNYRKMTHQLQQYSWCCINGRCTLQAFNLAVPSRFWQQKKAILFNYIFRLPEGTCWSWW